MGGKRREKEVIPTFWQALYSITSYNEKQVKRWEKKKAWRFDLTDGTGVINYNPCDHWMSPLFLKCSTDTGCLAAPKAANLTKSREWARTGVALIPTVTKSPTRTDAHMHPRVQEHTEEQGDRISHKPGEKTLSEYSFRQVRLVPAWYLIMQHRARLGDRSSEGAGKAELLLRRWCRKPGLERDVQWGKWERPSCHNRREERWAGAGMPAKDHWGAASQKHPKELK